MRTRARTAWSPALVIAIVAAAGGYMLGGAAGQPEARAADGDGDTLGRGLLAVPTGGRAIIVDQGRRVYVVDPLTGLAGLVEDGRGQPIIAR